MPKAKAAARKAVEADGSLAEAHVAMGLVSIMYDGDWAVGGKHFERAIDLNPASPQAHFEFANYLSALGRSEEALRERKRALDLDPVSPLFNSGLAVELYMARRYDEAIEQERKTLDIDASFPHAHLWLGRAYSAKGMYREAQAEFEKVPDYRGKVFLAYLDGRSGNRREALKALNDRSNQRSASPYPVAIICVGLGEKDQAFAWLERAYEERSFRSLLYLKVDPIWDPLRSDPRFADLLRRLGLSQ
jgi:Flp pilus assembly protein TadD